MMSIGSANGSNEYSCVRLSVTLLLVVILLGLVLVNNNFLRLVLSENFARYLNALYNGSADSNVFAVYNLKRLNSKIIAYFCIKLFNF